MTQQQAYDHIGAAIFARYDEWTKVVSQVQSWGEEVDTQVQKYINGIKINVLACLNWSFASERYFGKGNDITRETGRVAAVAL